MVTVTKNITCGGCFDRVGLVCVVHLQTVGYTSAACEEFRRAPVPPVERNTVTVTEIQKAA